MCGILILIVFVTNIMCQDMIGVNYSFDEDFNWNFNDKRCENKNRWHLVNYKDVDMIPLNEESTNGIVATANSCTSSFHLVFFPNSILELYVYTKLVSTNSGIVVLVVNEDNKPIFEYNYSRSNKNYIDGWCALTIPIEKNVKGYINLKGYSLHDEIVLIDSFKYTLTTKTKDEAENEDEKTFLNVEQRTEISDKTFQFMEGDDDLADMYTIEGSGSDEEEIDVNDPVIVEEKSSNALGPWVITLIVITVVTFLALIAVGSYHLGKLKGRDENLIFIEDEELPRVLSIPRVRMTTGSSIFST